MRALWLNSNGPTADIQRSIISEADLIVGIDEAVIEHKETMSKLTLFSVIWTRPKIHMKESRKFNLKSGIQ